MLANRYRVVAPLGKGGMGEVYRADDIELGVSVALKFLPPALAASPLWLERLRGEVRVARRVSHPHVCRVFDIGQAGDLAFISMEYVDGEDLGSLLRRIGRLPGDKAVQVARQVCLGVAAAHAQGILHRDLKPANIMIDGRGNAKVMDFGIASAASDRASSGQVAGTPAYMSPEQLRGDSLSERSDVYALGLVLFELFTGRVAQDAGSVSEAQRLQATGLSVRPSTLVPDLDPAVERVIERCLEADPARRPASAIAVAAALPGGDPLAAALEAGETPSPRLIAESGSDGSMSPLRAWTLAGLGALLLLGLAVLHDIGGLHRLVPREVEPAVLRAKALEMTRKLGPGVQERHQAWGFSYVGDTMRHLRERGEWSRAYDGSPEVVAFWLRLDPEQLRPVVWSQHAVSVDEPPMQPRSLLVRLDTTGRLTRFEAYPPVRGYASQADQNAPATLDWKSFFEAAGLDYSAFTSTASTFAPRFGADARFAWTGPMPTEPETTIRVEAASLDSVPTLFRLVPPWRDVPPTDATSELSEIVGLALNVLILVGVVCGATLAWINVRARRSDRAGAFRLAATLFGVEILAHALAHNSLANVASFDLLGRPLARAAWIGLLAWALYLAIEPSLRRFAPHALISWARLLEGRFADSLVARHVLVGLVVGGAGAGLYVLGGSTHPELGVLGNPHPIDLLYWMGGMHAMTAVLRLPAMCVGLSLLLVLLFAGIRASTKRSTPAYPIMTLVLVVSFFSGSLDRPVALAASVVCCAAVTTLILRVGLLSGCVALMAMALLINAPLTLVLDAWDAGPGLTVIAGGLALCGWAAWRVSLVDARALRAGG
ncbi:MAG: serine/threonine-protein kinase [Planctomycetota bacterium]|nr:serine/threonine-protein kinase [Planctomycetota bacterium]